MKTSLEWQKKHGIKTLVGTWLGDDLEKNEEEIEGLIQLAKEGCVNPLLSQCVGFTMHYLYKASISTIIVFFR